MTTTTEKTSVFQMGEAPYKFDRIWIYGSLEVRPECCNQSCAHCGTKIKNHFIIKDANNEEFAVGSSCIDLINDLIDPENAHIAEKERKRNISALKRQKAREEKERLELEAIELEKQRQRDVNGGITNYEYAQLEAKKKMQEYFAIKKEKYEPILAELKYLDRNGKSYNGFVGSMISQIEKDVSGYFEKALTPNQFSYIIQVLRKSHPSWAKNYFLDTPEQTKKYEEYVKLNLVVQKAERDYQNPTQNCSELIESGALTKEDVLSLMNEMSLMLEA